jgi:hypothetical protein
MVKPSKLEIPVDDISIESWIHNAHFILQFPATILIILSLLVAGTFAEIAPRKSLEFLDNSFGMILFFIIPLILTEFLDWPTGLLGVVVCLIIYTRLQKNETEEGFIDSRDDISSSDIEIIPNSRRWFVEKTLGERPIAISSDRVVTRAVEEENTRNSSLIASSYTSRSPEPSIFNSSSSNK